MTALIRCVRHTFKIWLGLILIRGALTEDSESETFRWIEVAFGDDGVDTHEFRGEIVRGVTQAEANILTGPVRLCERVEGLRILE